MNSITLEGFLSVLESTKPITINLYDEKSILLISFEYSGYSSLDNILEQDPVTKIVLKNIQAFDVYIDTSGN